VLGWKVANIPLVPGVAPRNEITRLDKARMIGLSIAPGDLIQHRKHRQKTLGVIVNDTDYINPIKVYEEIDEIETFFRKRGISIIDVTGKPIESCADEIVRIVKRNLKKILKNPDNQTRFKDYNFPWKIR
jgi:regulator of PEP synthase PpsR (kinase-PPPase family)